MSTPSVSLTISPWQRQPWKALYLTYKVATLAALHPYWVLKRLFHLRDAFPRSWTLLEVIHVQQFRHIEATLSACDFAPGVLDYRSLPAKSGKETRPVWIEAAGAEYLTGILSSKLAGAVDIPGYVWGAGKDDKDGPMNVGEGENVLLYLHGGGFMFGCAAEGDVTAANPRALLALVPSLKHGLTVDYRKVTQAPFPAAVIDCLSAYLYLLRRVKPSQVIVSGDSAGGSLALTLTRYIRDGIKRPDLLPKALVLFSPLASMETDLGPKHDLLPPKNLQRDLLDFNVIHPYMATRLLMTNPVSLIDSPWLSPASSVVPAEPALFANFPPAFITAGGAEVLLEGIVELERRMTLSGVKVAFHLEEDAPHDFQMFSWYKKEAGEALLVKTVNERNTNEW
ncbi:hypothetical protein RQP46_000137 [Phenoliferia psychrophenolica]